MSILRYFKRVNKTGAKQANDDGLPEPNGPLSKSVPPPAIELANAKVSRQLKAKNEGCSRGSRSKPYLMLTPGQRYEIGKRAAEHGVTATLRYYSEKYRDLPLSETSYEGLKICTQRSLLTTS